MQKMLLQFVVLISVVVGMSNERVVKKADYSAAGFVRQREGTRREGRQRLSMSQLVPAPEEVPAQITDWIGNGAGLSIAALRREQDYRSFG